MGVFRLGSYEREGGEGRAERKGRFYLSVFVFVNLFSSYLSFLSFLE
jgi:hypothetical protein